MSIRFYKSYTPATRGRAISGFSELTKSKPEKSLIRKNHRKKEETIEVLLPFAIEVGVTKRDIEQSISNVKSILLKPLLPQLNMILTETLVLH